MSKPRKRIRGHKNSCGQKKRFDTLEQASAAAFRGKKGVVTDFMHAYKCKRKACGGFHYGHPPK